MWRTRTTCYLAGMEQSISLFHISNLGEINDRRQPTVSPKPGEMSPVSVSSGSTAATHIYAIERGISEISRMGLIVRRHLEFGELGAYAVQSRLRSKNSEELDMPY